MADLSKIYSAVYSGVPVFEMVVNDVAVMRRRTDSYMNATQILKVAKIDKGKRTKILEKEVLIGEHEKVQGGYGKYQGTWIPFSKSRELAEKYGVLNEVGPLLNYELNSLGTEDGEDSSLLTKEQAIAARKRQVTESSQLQQQQSSQAESSQAQSIQSLLSSQPQTPQNSQYGSSPNLTPRNQRTHALSPSRTDDQTIPRKKAKMVATNAHPEGLTEEMASNDRDRSILMSIFISDKPEALPELIKNTQGRSTFNYDMVIDEQGHTALHWSTALARTKTVELLVARGANIACTSYTGETPLMRGVMVTNSFEDNSFPKILDLLKESIPIVDNKKRNVLHHAALTAGIQGRTNAAVYYMKNLLNVIFAESEEFSSVIDAQDSLGDTALTIAARMECLELVDILTEAGAAQSAENNNGLQMKDYSDKDVPMEESSQSQRTFPTSSLYSKKPYAPSQRGKEIVATVQKIVDALDDEYGGQLTAKEQELQSVQDELNAVTQELETTRKGLEERQAQSQRLSEAQQKTKNIEQALQVGWKQLEEIMTKADKDMPDPNIIDSIDENEDIDALFDIPELVISEDITEDEKKKQVEDYVRDVQAKVKAYATNDQELQKEIGDLEDQFVEKELQCKRLIAACCNLPIDKIDDLVEPLTLAIESDPPDLDLARVIGFMDKIRRQGAFVETATTPVSAAAIVSTPTLTASPPTDTGAGSSIKFNPATENNATPMSNVCDRSEIPTSVPNHPSTFTANSDPSNQDMDTETDMDIDHSIKIESNEKPDTSALAINFPSHADSNMADA